MAAEYRTLVTAQQSDLPAPPARPQRSPPLPRFSAPSRNQVAPSDHRQTSIQGSHKWIKASLPEESPCLLTGICLITDNVVVCDNENKTIKRFNVDGKFLEELFLIDPCGICALPKSKDVAITEPEAKQITICTLDVAIAVTFTLKTERKYQCITALDDKYVVGCCDLGSPCIDFIDSNGTVLRSLNNSSSSERLFRNPASITCLTSGELLISDPGSCSVICATINGDIKYKIDTQGRPSAICVDTTGKVYMAHYDSNLVYRLASNGESVDCVVVDQKYKLKSPLAMCLANDIVAITEETPSDRILIVKLPKVLDKQDTCVSLSSLEVNAS